MSQSKANDTTKSAKRKSSSARKSSTARKPATARKASASRVPVRRATTGRPRSNGVGPRKKRTIGTVEFIGKVAPTGASRYAGRMD